MSEMREMPDPSRLATNYKRIWLQPLCCIEERCWCADPQPCDDCGMPAIEYVRADLAKGRDDLLALAKFILDGIQRKKLMDQTILRRNGEEIETEALSTKIANTIAKAEGSP